MLVSGIESAPPLWSSAMARPGEPLQTPGAAAHRIHGACSSRSEPSALVAPPQQSELHLDIDLIPLDDGLVGLDGDHAGRRGDLARLDVESSVVEVALDDLVGDVALGEGARAMGAGVVDYVEG